MKESINIVSTHVILASSLASVLLIALATRPAHPTAATPWQHVDASNPKNMSHTSDDDEKVMKNSWTPEVSALPRAFSGVPRDRRFSGGQRRSLERELKFFPSRPGLSGWRDVEGRASHRCARRIG